MIPPYLSHPLSYQQFNPIYEIQISLKRPQELVLKNISLSVKMWGKPNIFIFIEQCSELDFQSFAINKPKAFLLAHSRNFLIKVLHG